MYFVKVDLLTAGSDRRKRRIVERAFIHLQRSIVVDPSVKKLWTEAYDGGEVRCEGLGAVHLLLHGIWAFKASATGERTDLVLGQPLTDLSQAEASAEALVLTEWKVIRNSKELDTKAEQAYRQASAYVKGVLAGFELAECRYLVLVSKRCTRNTTRSAGWVYYIRVYKYCCRTTASIQKVTSPNHGVNRMPSHYLRVLGGHR